MFLNCVIFLSLVATVFITSGTVTAERRFVLGVPNPQQGHEGPDPRHGQVWGQQSTQYSCLQCYSCYCYHTNCPPHLENPFIFTSAFFHCSTYGHLDCQANNQDGGWSHWENWEACQGTCQQALRQRRRHCTNPEPHNCGTRCIGENQQFESCRPSYCAHLGSQTTNSALAKAPSTAARTTVAMTTVLSTGSPVTKPPTLTSCSKLCAVSAVANRQAVLKRNTPRCAGNTTGSSEALPLHCCGDQSQRLIGQGVNVMARCPTFPKYTAVAAFRSGSVQSGTEGVFVGCLSVPEVGFQLIRQDCNNLPDLVHVNTTQSIYGNPYDYFALI